jgi:beta-lactamase regulating signal transducer with metallopeptidase domain
MQSRALEALEGLSGRAIWLLLAHSLWIVLLVAAIAAIAMPLLSRLPSRARYAVALAALVIATLGPVVAVPIHFALSARPSVHVPSAGLTTNALTTDKVGSVAAPISMHPDAHQRKPRRLNLALLIGDTRHQGVRGVEAIRPWQSLVVESWLLGQALMSFAIALAMLAILRLRRQAAPLPRSLQERAAALAERLRLRRVPVMARHDKLREPCLCGFIRHSVLLPGLLLTGARLEFLDAIIAHELAHARRRDPLVNLAQRLIEAIFLFHPGIFWISRWVRREREFCTDALAASATGQPLALAGALEYAASLNLMSNQVPVLGTYLGGHSALLLPRIQELVGMKPSRPRPALWPFAALPAAGVLALFAVSGGIAQESIAPPKAATYGTPVPKRAAGAQPQLTFIVRYIQCDANSWRDRILDRLKLVYQDGDVSAWTIDERAIYDLLTEAQADTRSNVIQLPKADAPESAVVKISSVAKKHYVAQVDKVAAGKGDAFKPTVKAIKFGLRFSASGSLLHDGTRLSIDLHDIDLLKMHTLTRTNRVDGRKIVTSYEVPTLIERHCKLTQDIPESSALLVSLGMNERGGRLSDPGEAASDLLKLVGLPPVPARLVPCERLVMIEARRHSPAGHELK